MGRNCRVKGIGVIYHVIQRGNNKKYVFEKDEDKGFLIKQVKKYKEGLSYRIYGFVIMDNHYHFIIQTFEQSLEKIMHRWNSNYSKYYNYKHLNTGHVFQGRYKSVLVEDEIYLLELLRYIHNNPVRAGIVENIQDYKWSSDVFYRTHIQTGVVDIDTILQMISPVGKESIINYRKYMEEVSIEPKKECEERVVLDEEAYRLLIKTTAIRQERKSLEDIFGEIEIGLEERRLLKEGSKMRTLTAYKIQYIQKARQMNYTLQEIGESIGMKKGGIHNLIKRYDLKC